MSRRAFSLLELLVVIAIISLLIGIILPAIVKIRAAASRTACLNNLKQIGLASNSYQSHRGAFPHGGAPPAKASAIVHLLPYLEQENLYKLFDFEADVSADKANHEARTHEFVGFLCPADPATEQQTEKMDGVTKYLGRTSYFGNLGAHASFMNSDPKTAGMFRYGTKPSPVKISDVTDGASNTALFAEIRRGRLKDNDPENVWTVSYTLWDDNKQKNDLAPFPECDEAADSYSYRGSQYYRGVVWCSMYTHTVPVNHTGRDCMRGKGVNKAHIASRSYHAGGVNVAFVDGSVRFIRDNISMDVWRAIGTRSAQDLAE